MTPLEKELARLLASGMTRVSFARYQADIAAMGFKLDRANDCRCNALDVATGERFPAITGYARQESTDKGFANIDADRSAPGWQQFREYRRNHFAVLRGAIFTA